jgi:hypothetical protein
MDLGGQGQAPGEFWLPAGIAVNDGGLMVVADGYNRRLQWFRMSADDAMAGPAGPHPEADAP